MIFGGRTILKKILSASSFIHFNPKKNKYSALKSLSLNTLEKRVDLDDASLISTKTTSRHIKLPKLDPLFFEKLIYAFCDDFFYQDSVVSKGYDKKGNSNQLSVDRLVDGKEDYYKRPKHYDKLPKTIYLLDMSLVKKNFDHAKYKLEKDFFSYLFDLGFTINFLHINEDGRSNLISCKNMYDFLDISKLESNLRFSEPQIKERIISEVPSLTATSSLFLTQKLLHSVLDKFVECVDDVIPHMSTYFRGRYEQAIEKDDYDEFYQVHYTEFGNTLYIENVHFSPTVFDVFLDQETFSKETAIEFYNKLNEVTYPFTLNQPLRIDLFIKYFKNWGNLIMLDVSHTSINNEQLIKILMKATVLQRLNLDNCENLDFKNMSSHYFKNIRYLEVNNKDADIFFNTFTQDHNLNTLIFTHFDETNLDFFEKLHLNSVSIFGDAIRVATLLKSLESQENTLTSLNISGELFLDEFQKNQSHKYSVLHNLKTLIFDRYNSDLVYQPVVEFLILNTPNLERLSISGFVFENFDMSKRESNENFLKYKLLELNSKKSFDSRALFEFLGPMPLLETLSVNFEIHKESTDYFQNLVSLHCDSFKFHQNDINTQGNFLSFLKEFRNEEFLRKAYRLDFLDPFKTKISNPNEADKKIIREILNDSCLSELVEESSLLEWIDHYRKSDLSECVLDSLELVYEKQSFNNLIKLIYKYVFNQSQRYLCDFEYWKKKSEIRKINSSKGSVIYESLRYDSECDYSLQTQCGALTTKVDFSETTLTETKLNPLLKVPITYDRRMDVFLVKNSVSFDKDGNLIYGERQRDLVELESPLHFNNPFEFKKLSEKVDLEKEYTLTLNKIFWMPIPTPYLNSSISHYFCELPLVFSKETNPDLFYVKLAKDSELDSDVLTFWLAFNEDSEHFSSDIDISTFSLAHDEHYWCVDYFINHIKADSQALKTNKEKIELLITYFSSFSSVGDDFTSSGFDIIYDVVMGRKGTCHHRSLAFYLIATRLGIPTLFNSNGIHGHHSFVLVNLGDGWEKIDLGGASVNIVEETNPLSLDLPQYKLGEDEDVIGVNSSESNFSEIKLDSRVVQHQLLSKPVKESFTEVRSSKRRSFFYFFKCCFPSFKKVKKTKLNSVVPIIEIQPESDSAPVEASKESRLTIQNLVNVFDQIEMDVLASESKIKQFLIDRFKYPQTSLKVSSDRDADAVNSSVVDVLKDTPNVDHVYINSPDDFYNVWEYNILELNSSKPKKIMGVLQKCVQQNKKMVVVINWTNFSAYEVTHFQSILDDDRRLFSTPIFSNVSVLNLIDSHYVEKLPENFVSRLNFLPIRLECQPYLPYEDVSQFSSHHSETIHFNEFETWQHALLGKRAVGKDGFYYEKSDFQKFLESNVSSFRFVNEPKSDPEYRRFIIETLQKRKVIINGETINLSNTFSLVSVEETMDEEFSMKDDYKFTIGSPSQYEDALVVDSHNFYSLFKTGIKATHDGSLVSVPSLIDQISKESGALFVTESLTDVQWQLLLKKCPTCLRDKIYISSTISLPVHFKANSKMELFKNENVILTDDSQKELYLYQLFNSDTIVVPITTEFNISDLVGRLSFQKDVLSGDMLFNYEETDLARALLRGEDLILVGVRENTEFFRSISSLIAPVPYIIINGVRHKISGKVSVIIEKSTKLSPYIKEIAVDGETTCNQAITYKYPNNGDLLFQINELEKILVEEHYIKERFSFSLKSKLMDILLDDLDSNQLNQKLKDVFYSKFHDNPDVYLAIKGHVKDIFHIQKSESLKKSNRLTRLLERVVNSIIESPVVFGVGLPGVGKSYTVSAVKSKLECLGFETTVFYGNDQLKEWAKASSDDTYFLLVLDEANCAKANFWNMFYGLKETRPNVIIDGEIIFVSERHRVYMNGNPSSFEQRSELEVVQDIGHTLWFKPLDESFLREKVLRPLFKILDIGKLDVSIIIEDIFANYAEFQQKFPNRYLSVRDLESISLKFHINPKKSIHRLFEEELDLDSSNTESSSDIEFLGDLVITKAEKSCIEKLLLNLEVRHFRIQHPEYESKGKHGFLLEGDAGEGKSLIAKEVLKKYGYVEGNVSGTRFVQSRVRKDSQRTYYEITLSNYEDAEKIIEKAFNEGSILIINELNGLPIENLINCFLTGVNKKGQSAKVSGFFVIATQNPTTTYTGRFETTKATLNRMHVVHSRNKIDIEAAQVLVHKLKLAPALAEIFSQFHFLQVENSESEGKIKPNFRLLYKASKAYQEIFKISNSFEVALREFLTHYYI